MLEFVRRAGVCQSGCSRCRLVSWTLPPTTTTFRDQRSAMLGVYEQVSVRVEPWVACLYTLTVYLSKNNWNKNEAKKYTGWALWTVAKSQTILFPVDKSFPLGGSDLRCGRVRERGEELPTQLRWIPDSSGEVKGSRWKGLWYTFHMPCIEPHTAHCAPGSEDAGGLIPYNIITIFEVRQEISTKTYFPPVSWLHCQHNSPTFQSLVLCCLINVLTKR